MINGLHYFESKLKKKQLTAFGIQEVSCFNVGIWTVLWGHDGEGHRDLFCLSHASCFTAYLHESCHNLRADGQWRTLVPSFDNGANAVYILEQALSAVQALMLAVVALKQPAIEY